MDTYAWIMYWLQIAIETGHEGMIVELVDLNAQRHYAADLVGLGIAH